MNLLSPKEQAIIIANRIRTVRCDQGFNQAQIAQKCGLSLASYRRFEQRGEIAFVSLIKIVQSLHLDDQLDHLFERKSFKSLDEVELAARERDGLKRRVRSPAS